MVAAKLYERGVSYGQVLAFLIASPLELALAHPDSVFADRV